MAKVLARFFADPSPANWLRTVTYFDKHPMAACLLRPEEVAKLRSLEVEV